MSPTAFYKHGIRFFFFSLEEDRLHIHVRQADKQAKIWIDPVIDLAENRGFSSTELTKIIEEVRKHEADIRKKWQEHRRSYDD